MLNSSHKAKRFLFPILSLVLISIISIASINAYITIDMFKTHMHSHIADKEINYFNHNKNEISKDVQRVNDAIKYQNEQIEKRLKKSLQEKVETALEAAQFVYDTYKDKFTEKQLKQRIARYLSGIKFNDGRGYYFMYDNKTKVIFGNAIKKFIGVDMTGHKDVRGQDLMELDEEVLKNNKIGFSKIYFNKPNKQDKEFPKITCIAKFEPLDIVIGTGEYLDVVEKQAKKAAIKRFSRLFNDDNRYLVLMDLHDINGGDDFATILINSNKPSVVGKKISDSYKDTMGKEYRKEYLKVLKEKGEGFVKYSYKKPHSKISKPKMSYFYLQKDWNWIISTGFYFDDLEKDISEITKAERLYTKETINKTLLIVAVLSFILILIAIFVSIRIDKTIQKYTDKITEHEKNKRKQDKLIVQQSKMASMGEMIESIAHQWKQPLTTISMVTNNIRLDVELDEVKNEELVKYATDIANQTEHLSHTVDDFRQFFKQDKEKRDFSIKDLFHRTQSLLISKLKNRDITIIENIDDVTINGFGNELIQVFMNVLNNAREQLEQQDYERLLFVNISKDENMAVVKIKDNGGGIPSDIINKIFDSHFTTKEENNGTGIGLYMSKKIIDKSFFGTFEVKNTTYKYEDKEYTGAEFIINLPI